MDKDIMFGGVIPGSQRKPNSKPATAKQLAARDLFRSQIPTFRARLAAKAGVDPTLAFQAGTEDARRLMDYVRAAKKRPITQAEAQAAFNRFYKSRANSRMTRGPNKGALRFASPRGRKAAMTYDLNHSSKPSRVITDARYLRNPGRWDYPGVDTGAKVRKVSPKQLANQQRFAAMARARATGAF